MMGQLFKIEEKSLHAKLELNLELGVFFYTISEVKHLLNLTDAQVRYAIRNYRLDALLIFGEYRIPYTAVLRYSEEAEEEQDREYFSMMSNLEIPGIYALNVEGDLRPIKEALEERELPYSVITNIPYIDKKTRFDNLPGIEESKQDWYGLDELNLPYSLTAYEWADLLSTRTQYIAAEFGVKYDEEIDWPTIYDYLIESEVVNLEIPYSVEFDPSSINSMNSSELVQLSLFDEL